MEASDYSTAASESAATNGHAQSPWDAHEAAESVGRPEIPVIAAFVGGFVLAKILRSVRGVGDD
jgi:hypothetical protein